MARWMMVLLAGLSLSLAACDDDEETGDSHESDTDTDVDTDADADACPTNSGWPCTCDIMGYPCDDKSDCIALKGFGDGTKGYCAPDCIKGGSCPKTAFDGVGQCVVESGKGDYWCALICLANDDCPPDQACDTEHGGICYPM